MSVALHLGVGAGSAATPGELAALVRAALAEVPGRVVALATLDGKQTHPAILALASELAVPVVAFPAAALSRVAVPTPSPTALATVATPSVAEAAALLSASPDPRLALPKRTSPHATIALASGRTEPARHTVRTLPAQGEELRGDRSAAPR